MLNITAPYVLDCRTPPQGGMKAVVQRVISASVAVDGKVISQIGKGLLVLVGVDRYDQATDSSFIIKKILGAKLFPGDNDSGPWKRSVMDVEGEVLCVSQFTLFANFKGMKPDFHESMPGSSSRSFYSSFLEEIRRSYVADRIKDGEFGAMMQVSLVNDGPVTVTFESRDKAISSTSEPTATNGRSGQTREKDEHARLKALKKAELEQRTMDNARWKAEARAMADLERKGDVQAGGTDTAPRTEESSGSNVDQR
ncbi:D-Tyr tRNAtyr deacylase-like domain-containing protein [Kockovaella imperatae]|uniref:D-aminoacyl-tRNA deacylase n=1 Tax=Kockovaella imperatae TaxID=4999 RepID=A0A1Y1UQI7_9TREE|nr:D-Tyr tRNAtyr deacylase-like domain-containing protein [Kockovaella imperatae]ORX39817.1 D-Tyr tRNAtyr deacylase-like domain-containing protein [Kockovaella imperatae]